MEEEVVVLEGRTAAAAPFGVVAAAKGAAARSCSKGGPSSSWVLAASSLHGVMLSLVLPEKMAGHHHIMGKETKQEPADRSSTRGPSHQ